MGVRVGELPFLYIIWHYGEGWRVLYYRWQSIMWGLFHFFSLPLLLKYFFTRFHQLGEEKTIRGFDLNEFLQRMIINFIMRLVGVFLRTFILLSALVVMTVWILVLPLMALFWLFAPFVILALFLGGLFILFFKA